MNPLKLGSLRYVLLYDVNDQDMDSNAMSFAIQCPSVEYHSVTLHRRVISLNDIQRLSNIVI